MSKPMEELRQVALSYEKQMPLASDEFSIPPTGNVLVNVNTLFAAIEAFDMAQKVIFAMTGLAKDMRAELDDQQSA
jgi:hypothetical protein